MPRLATKEEINLRREIGTRIRRLMLERGWNQSRLATEATKYFKDGEITRGNVSAWINGGSLPGPLRAEALAKALGVSADTFRPPEALETIRQNQDARREALHISDAGTGKAHVQFSRTLPWELALQIINLVNQGDADGGGFDNLPTGRNAARQPANGDSLASRRADKTVVHASKRSR